MPLITPGVYLSLYAVTDLFSRYTVAWMISLKENSALAMQLMEEASVTIKLFISVHFLLHGKATTLARILRFI